MTALKRKGWIKENNLPLKIVFLLYQKSRPLSLSEIANSCKCPRQKIEYHLQGLIGRGIILKDPTPRYTIQPGLLNKDFLELLIPLLTAILEHSDLSQATQSPEETAASIIEYFLQLHVLE